MARDCAVPGLVRRYRPSIGAVLGATVLAGVALALLPHPEQYSIQEAARQPDAQAHYVLGQMYAAGITVRKDPVRAHMWLSVAADGGHDEAARLRDTLALRMTRRDILQASRMTRKRHGDPTFLSVSQ